MWCHRRQPTRLPHPWDSPGKNTGVGCHFLLQCRKVKSEREVAQSCPTLRDPMDCSLPGSSALGIFQARVLEWGAIAFSDSRSQLCMVYQFPKTAMTKYYSLSSTNVFSYSSEVRDPTWISLGWNQGVNNTGSPPEFLGEYLFICLGQVLVGALRIFSWSMWDLVPWPGMAPRPPAVGTKSH